MLQYFHGKWSILRNSTGSLSLSAEGFALFDYLNNDKNIISYSEELTLLSPTKIKARQRYFYSEDLKSKKIIKYFSDMRKFYEMILNKNCAIGSHQCGQDHYNASYHFDDQDQFKLSYEVSGPQKEYNIFSIYTRIS